MGRVVEEYIWPIAGFPDYGVTEAFDVVRLTPKRGTKVGRKLKWVINSKGYASVSLRSPNGGRPVMILRAWLVCERVNGPRPSGLFCLHNDGDRGNDTPGNHRWGTPAENNADTIRHGRGGVACGDRHRSKTKPQSILRGVDNPAAKLRPESVLAIRRASGRYADIGVAHGVTASMVGQIKRGRAWRSLP